MADEQEVPDAVEAMHPLLLRGEERVGVIGGHELRARHPDDLSLVTDGTLTVCTDSPYEPFEFEDPSSPSGYAGFDIDLLQAVADRLELTLSVTNTGFEPIQSGVAMNANQCDIAAAAMTITEERAANINFTDSYYSADQSLLVPVDSGLTTLADLAGMTIGVQSDTTGQEYAEENAPADATIVDFASPADLFIALDAGTIDAILQDRPVNENRADKDDSVQVVETYETGENYGFGSAKEGKETLVTAVNRILAEMRDDGTYDEIFDRYFG